MMKVKATLPRGVRDFSPQILQKRQFIINIIKSVFEKFSFSPIETPALENLSTLIGKYGDEGDRLIFKVLNSGNYLEKTDNNVLKNKDFKKITPQISNKGLRYDLTVPFTRYVVQNINDITFPFRRYQIQPVWRADRPQKGRFREFYQCDADIIGSKSLWCEIELLQLYDEVFTQLKIPVTIKVNHRMSLKSLIDSLGEIDKTQDIITALDKLEKRGKEKVLDELKQKQLGKQALNKLDNIIDKVQNNKDVYHAVPSHSSPVFKEGITQLKTLFNKLEKLELQTANIQYDPILARGLSYYTGMIFEVKANDIDIGALGGGGRYDDLTQIFGLEDISGVGISFGVDRIFMVMKEKNIFPDFKNLNNQILFVNFGEEIAFRCMEIIKKLRKHGIISELYPDSIKLKKQMQYANKKNIPFVAFVGSEEMTNQEITLKTMETGTQEILSVGGIINKFKKLTR